MVTVKTYEESGEWFGRLEDIVEYIEEEGYTVSYADCENVSFYDDDDDEYVAKIGGLGRTLYIDRIVEAL